MTNAGFYLLDTGFIRGLIGNAEIERLRLTRFDFGKDLLPWLVGNGFPVHVFPVRKIGDLGNVRDYLETMIDALRGDFESVDRLLGPAFDPDRNVWIAPSRSRCATRPAGRRSPRRSPKGRCRSVRRSGSAGSARSTRGAHLGFQPRRRHRGAT